jgi:hypothetical protein
LKYKGKQKLNNETVERIKSLREARCKKARDIVLSLDGDQVKALLLTVSDKQPSIILDAIETSQSGGIMPPSSSNNLSWCVCNYCREMPTDIERLCCGQQHTHCISRLPVSLINDGQR